MAIRITGRNKTPNGYQSIDSIGFIAPSAGNLKVSYTDRKASPRILCGSI